MTEHRNIFDKVIGLEEKREYREFENRAHRLGASYYQDYIELKKYIWHSGVSKWTDFKFIFEQILDLLEEAKVQDKELTDLIGPDVATFIDEMIDDSSWEKKQKDKLNKGVKNGFR